MHSLAGAASACWQDLRFITTGLKITTDLERIGDMAVNICERALELNNEPALKPYIDIRGWRISQRMIRESLDAFVEDTDLALKVCKDDQQVDDLNSQIFRETVSFMIEDPHTINRAMKIGFISEIPSSGSPIMQRILLKWSFSW
jgi:phosphate transport system protein